MRSETAFVVGLSVLVLAMSACGGDDSDGGGQTGGGGQETLSRQEVIARGDTLCKEFREDTERLLNRADRVADPKEQAGILHRVADRGEKVADEFDSFDPPPGDARIIDRYVSVSREQLALLRRAADSLEQGDAQEAGTLLDSGQGKGAELRGIAQGYGFKVCGSERD
jgi:hypothetical protein